MARKKQSEKNDNVEAGVIDLSKELGLTLYGDVEHSAVLNRLPTMIPHLDYVLGGGLPFGRMVEIIGKNSSGKSTFAVAMTKIAQELDVPAVWIDIEGTADPIRLADLGVDFGTKENPKGVYMIEPKKVKNKKTGKMEKETLTVEKVAEQLEALVPVLTDKGAPCLIVWDSVAQTVTQTELERGVGDKQPGIKAKALSQFASIIAPMMTNSQVLFLAINQARDEMGSMFGGIDSPGGHALHHWASLRLEVQKASKIEDMVPNAFGAEEKAYVGHIMRIKTIKSKVSRPQQKAEMYLMADTGLNFEENVYRSCQATNKQYGLISGGTWKTYKALDGQEYKFNSDKNWVAFLKAPEGAPVLQELFGRMMAISFPDGYAPYNNKAVDIRKIPLYKAIENYQVIYGAKPEVEQPTVEPTGVEDLLQQIKD